MSPERRHELLEGFVGRSTIDQLDASLVLYQAHREKDHVLLGFESWALYLDSIGVSRSQDSKMRRLAFFFAGTWTCLPVVDQKRLTVERLYAAARLGEKDHLTVADALALAVNTPSHELVARLKDEELEPTMCVCDSCGNSHRRKEVA